MTKRMLFFLPKSMNKIHVKATRKVAQGHGLIGGRKETTWKV